MSIFQDPQSGEWYQGPDLSSDPFQPDEEETLRTRGIVRDPQSGDFYQVPQSSISHWRRPEPVMAPQAPAEPTLEEGVGLADYAKSVMAGGAQIGQAAGWLMRRLGAEDMGGAIETLGRDAVDYWNEGLSDAAKDALSREFVRKNEAGEWEWGDANLHTVGLFGAQSLLGTLAGAGAGAGITKVLQTFANPVGRSALLRAAQAGSDQALKKLALVDKVIGAAGFATGEGLVGGASAGVNVYDRIMSMDPAKITENPRYRQVYESTDETMPELERHQYAAETVAREASTLAGLQSGLTTALLGAPMGAFFGSMFGKSSIGKLAQSRAARAATGAGGEAAQEFAQGAAEQAISNVAVRDAGDTDVDVWDDVLNQALGGALAGAPIGGALGLAEQPEQARTPSLDEMQEKFPPAKEMLALPAPRGEADFTVGPDGEAIPRGQIRPERPALPAPGANADFTVTSDGETIPRGEARTTPPDPMQQWARDSRAMRAGINADQATRQQQEAEALGQSPASKWKPETVERVKAAATEAVQAGADREAVLEVVRTAASGKIAPVVAMRRMSQLRAEAGNRQALPSPRAANAFEVDPEGQARQLTEAEARQANDRVAGAQQARVDMGTAPTKAPGLGGKREQVVQAGWKADTIKRVQAAADAAVEAGVPREVADGVLARMSKGEVKPLVAARQLKQLQNAQATTPTETQGATPKETIVNEGAGTFSVQRDGKEIARADVADDGKGDYLTNVRVESEFRRQGVATRLYDEIERVTGRKLRPSPTAQSDDAKAFWADRGGVSRESLAAETQGKPATDGNVKPLLSRGGQRFAGRPEWDMKEIERRNQIDGTASEFAGIVQEEYAAGTQSPRNILAGFEFNAEQASLKPQDLAEAAARELEKHPQATSKKAAALIREKYGQAKPLLKRGGKKRTAEELEAEARTIAARMRARAQADREAGLEQISDETAAANLADRDRVSDLMRQAEELRKPPPVVKQEPKDPDWFEDMTEEQRATAQRYPKTESARNIRKPSESLHVSAQSFFKDYEVLPGVRDIPMEDLGELPGYDDKKEARRIRNLADEIQENGEIEPIFVAIDPDGTPYVMEGQHRSRAYKLMGEKTIPARVVVDFDPRSTPKRELEPRQEYSGEREATQGTTAAAARQPAPLRRAGGERFTRTQGALRSHRERSGTTSRSYARASQGDGGTRRVLGSPTRAEFTPSAGFRGTLEAIGAATPSFHELTPEGAQLFADSISASKQGNRFGAAVYVYPVEEYAQMRLFLTEDGKAGFALKGDDIVSVFALAPHKGAAPGMLELAVQEGGRRLDAFDTVLPDLYAANGFRTVARISWNDDYAPEGWDKATFAAFNNGQPDVVFMVYDPANAAAPTAEDGQRVEDYDAAVALQKEAVAARPQTESAAFRRWFGDSKVVDEKGRPKRVYHGTNASFDTFLHNSIVPGFYFADDPQVAGEYGGNDRANVMPAYLSLQNPVEFDGDGAEWHSIDARLLPPEVRDQIPENHILENRAGVPQVGLSSIFQVAKAMGMDGVIAHNVRDGGGAYGRRTPATIYIASKPEQIKSATGNSGAFNPEDPSILKRQGQVRPAVQQALGRVQAELKDFVAGIGALVNVQIHATTADMQAATGMEIPDDTKGAWLPGTNTVHIVAENHAPGEAITTAVHETFGHLAIFRYEEGRRAVDSVTRQIRQGAAWTKPYVAEVTKTHGTLTDMELAAEVIALMAERGEQNLTLTKLIAGIRRFLRKLGVKMEFSDADIRDLIARSARALKQEAAQLRPKLAALTPAATDQQILDAIEEQFPANVVALDAYMALRSARERATGELAEQLDAEIAALEGRKPEGDTTLHLKKPLRSAAKVTDTQAFRRWFGDSKVVNDEGQPLVVYHGTTKDFSAFERSGERDEGYLGKGFYFADASTASSYAGASRFDFEPRPGGNVMPVYLSLQNPLELDAQFEGRREVDRGIVVRKALNLPESATAEEVTQAARAAGHDGVIYTYKGTKEYAVFHANKIKSATGNRGTFDTASTNILFRRGAAAADPKVQAILDRVMIKPPEAMTMRDKARELWHKITDTSSLQLKQGFIDSFASIEALERNANNGALKDAAESAYKAALATKNLSSVMAGVMLKGVPQFANGAYVPVAGRRGIVDIFNPLTQHKDGNLLSQWEGYAAARRASRLIKEQNVDGSSRENLFTQDEIDTLLTLGKKYPEFDTVFNEWQAFNKQVLDLAQDAGVIDPTTRVLWERNDYVPFYRVAEELGSKTGPSNKAGLANQSSGIRQLKGGEAQLGNVFENMMMNTAHLIDASFKNRAMQRIVDLGTGTAMEKVDLDWEAVKFNDAQLAAALRKAGIEVESMDKAQREHWSTLFRRIAPKGPNIVSVMKAGKPEYYEVTDPLVLQSIAGLGYDNFADVFGLFRGSKKLLTNAITADPAFMMANFVRDTLSNWVISDASTKPMVDAVKALGATLKDDPDLVQLMMAGAGGGGFYDSAPEDIRKLIASRVPANQQRAFLDSVVGPKNVWRLWRKIGAAAENANRIATFRAVLAAGGSVAEAAYQARDVLNFSMAGNFGAMRWLVQSVPFLNARVQGLYRLYRGARDNKRGFFMKGAMLTAATMALALANEDDDEYEELPEWDKDTYWHLFVGGEHWRIPKPFEVGALFSTIPERLYRTAAGRDSTSVLADRMFQMFADTFAFNPVPQLVKPIIEQYANRSMFTGSPIVGMAEQPLQPEAQFTPWTSETMQELAKAMPDFAPAWLRSPKRLEAALRAYTGAIGMYVLGISDQAVRGALGYPEEPSRKIYDLPVVSRFWKDPDPRHTKYADQLYEMMDEANAISSTINRYTRERRFGEAAELRSENKSKLAVRVRLNRLGTQVRNINHQIRLIQLDATMDPDMKRTRIDALVDRKNDTTREVARYSDIF